MNSREKQSRKLTCIVVVLGRRRDTERLLTVVLVLDAIVPEERCLAGRYPVCLDAEEDADRGADGEGDEDKVEKPEDTHDVGVCLCEVR